ncbi:hypothetical protein COHA_002421 [Chlorella ohadii]|uniref:Uncharacterized protein n=1 Tax=Chlorella ohadii TaxID=2649997 RepID=A0AAD5H4D5_9CHLO|nr:hypothetical protein COHA_002421 [Chlorella ohadii]
MWHQPAVTPAARLPAMLPIERCQHLVNIISPSLTCAPYRAERGSGSFWSGFIVGGVVCGALGFVFAPQISKALLGDDDRLKLRWDEAADGEVTKQNLADKIAQLNAAIDDVSSQLNARDAVKDEAKA